MRQTFSRLFRANLAGSAGRTLVMGMATAGMFVYQYKQNKLPTLIQQYAFCAAQKYEIPSQAELDRARSDLLSFIEEEKYLAPLLIRLSWHDAGTYSQKDGSGGPRACMRFSEGESKHGANAGLNHAQAALADLKKKYPNISNADFWSLAAVCAIKVMGGPDVAWRAGRPDADEANDSVPDGRLPDATQGCHHLRTIFHRMGFSD